MDRQDIDALLVGALYGELSPAEEARLAAHLEAHPADRGALDDLKSARAQVQESRIFQESTEPPQHISALLLQEAHRRAPKRAVASQADSEGGWFFRVTRMFLAHPAMAAAAMLVLVLGVAGTLYSKKGSDFASRTAPSKETTAAAPAEPAMVAADPAPGSATFNAQLADERMLAEGAKQQVAAAESASDRWEKNEDKVAQPKAEPPRRRSIAIAVTTEQQQPKDFERAKDSKAPSVAKGAAAVKADLSGDDDGAYDIAEATTATTTGGYRDSGRAGAVGGGAAPAANTGMAQPPPPPPAPPPTADNFAAAPKPAAPEAKPSTSTVAKPSPSTTSTPPADSSLIAWAKTTHSQAAAKVKAGDCQAAAKLALTVSNRAPEYYSQYMATDRQLKSCKQYIDSERDKDAERANKTRTQKRVNAEESMPSQGTK